MDAKGFANSGREFKLFDGWHEIIGLGSRLQGLGTGAGSNLENLRQNQ